MSVDGKTVSAHAAAAAGVLLFGVGIAHNALGIPVLRRAVGRGEISARLSGAQLVNWIFSGAAMSLFGILVVVLAFELRLGRRSAWRLGSLIGLFFVLAGIGAYALVPNVSVLLFSGIGALISGPLLFWRKEFDAG